MDADARRYCGLLMFDAPVVSKRSQTPRDNEITSTREVDHLSNNWDQSIVQDSSSDFSTTTRALAAGAAAGDDQGGFHLSNSNRDDSTLCLNAIVGSEKRTPRPPNAFILYRREKQPAIIAANRHLSNADVSRQISDMWRNEPEEVRLEWERYADRKKLEHMQTYPNYVYRPNKKSKVDKRRKLRKQVSGSTVETLIDQTITSKNNSGPVRKKSIRNKNNDPRNLDSPTSRNYGSPSINRLPQDATILMNSSHTTILPSMDISLLTAHFPNASQEYVDSHAPPQQTQLREHETKLRQQQQIDNNLMCCVQGDEIRTAYQHHQGNTAQFSLTPINGLENSIHHHNAASSYSHHQTVDPFEYCFVPDVARQQRQMLEEMMLHYEQHPPHITPIITSPSPTSNHSSPHARTSIYPQQPVHYLPHTHAGTTVVEPDVENNSSIVDINMLAGYEYQNYTGNHQYL